LENTEFCRFYRETWVISLHRITRCRPKQSALLLNATKRIVNALDNLPGSASP